MYVYICIYTHVCIHIYIYIYMFALSRTLPAACPDCPPPFCPFISRAQLAFRLKDWAALHVWLYLSNTASWVVCTAYRVKDRHSLFNYLQRLKRTSVRQVVLDKWYVCVCIHIYIYICITYTSLSLYIYIYIPLSQGALRFCRRASVLVPVRGRAVLGDAKVYHIIAYCLASSIRWLLYTCVCVYV